MSHWVYEFAGCPYTGDYQQIATDEEPGHFVFRERGTSVQGEQGFQGSQGEQGFQGSQGGTGAQGLQGSQGGAGVQGAQVGAGAQGEQDAQGGTGAQGEQDAQGGTGAQGCCWGRYDRTAGSAGLTGSAPATHFVRVIVGPFNSAIARCPAGSVATGGGYLGPEGDSGVVMGNHPVGFPATDGWWQVAWSNVVSNREVFVVCQP